MTGLPSRVRATPGAACTVTSLPCRSRVPAKAGALPSGKMTVLSAPEPMRFSPSFNQKSPTRLSHPSGRLRPAIRSRCQAAISCS